MHSFIFLYCVRHKKAESHNSAFRYPIGLNSSLPTPQIGQTQSSGISSKAVPGAIPLSGSPTAGS